MNPVTYSWQKEVKSSLRVIKKFRTEKGNNVKNKLVYGPYTTLKSWIED